ncbi:MAG: hypothetical protein A2X82_07470 [Geobacteraceae bacterium GWC2_55_20]|nr:MAG: hypothetical protein A2X82_07470 [Geobacteraceae bacterium GWC2_55_20]OGU18686.1 MAG: hypothetical protein A2X85_01180 [Geobacteraceae bacterium GWF2_54_21]HBA73217.1 ribbon-helix-helix protein, CopG family [Geobacter sp.]HCE67603.1 ribbon-helix-helix protein, CopG family [Geobacter sp.]
MAKTKVTPRSNIISMRVSEKERQILKKLASRHKLSISDMMRHAMESFTNNQYDSGMGHTA